VIWPGRKDGQVPIYVRFEWWVDDLGDIGCRAGRGHAALAEHLRGPAAARASSGSGHLGESSIGKRPTGGKGADQRVDQVR
jgi:hypothetical protein